MVSPVILLWIVYKDNLINSNIRHTRKFVEKYALINNDFKKMNLLIYDATLLTEIDDVNAQFIDYGV